jgi:CBS domain-containing protein
MNVQNILDGKAAGGVTTIASSASLGEAVAVLAERRIGAVVISANGREVEGIISERDIVRELARRGAAALELKVLHVMTRRIVSCAPGDTSESVMARMSQGGFRHMPVMAGGVLVGIISIRDVVKARLDDLAMEKGALENMIMGF